MLMEYRCGCGQVFERIVARGNLAPQRCSCGKQAKRLFSTFNQKQYRIDRSNWALIAPQDAEGRPLSMKEAASVVDTYSPGQAEREQRRQARARAEKRPALVKQAADAAWKQLHPPVKVRSV